VNKILTFLALLVVASLLFVSGIVSTNAADQQGLTIAKVESWLKGYEQAWETLDADKAAVLFTERCHLSVRSL